MSTATATSHPSNVPATTLLRRAASAEWTRLWTLRSTWWALLAGAALMLFIGAATNSGHEAGHTEPIWQTAQTAFFPAQFAFLLVVVLAVTPEYSTGAIRSTLQWAPRRSIVLAARLIVPVGFVTVCAIVVSAATGLVAWGFLGQAAEVVPGDIAVSLGKIALVVAFGGLLTAAIGLLLRSTAGTLVTIFLLVFALPAALANSAVPWLITISDQLPGRAIVSILVIDQVVLTASAIATVMIAWTVLAVLAGGWSLIRRDTT